MSVQNTLEGILSQKVVQASNGYSVKNDIVNIDTITCSIINSSWGASGQATIVLATGGNPPNTSVRVTISGMTTNGIVILTPANSVASTGFASVDVQNGYFDIILASQVSGNAKYNWAIMKY
jgi:hypothetical protein